MLALALQSHLLVLQSFARLHQSLQFLTRCIARLARDLIKRLGEPGNRVRVDRIVLGQAAGRAGEVAHSLRINDPHFEAGLAQRLGPLAFIAAGRLHHRFGHLVLTQPGHQLAAILCGTREGLLQRQRANASIHLVFCHIDAHDNPIILCHHPRPFLLGTGSQPMQLSGLRKTHRICP